jgi:hypothetical protein
MRNSNYFIGILLLCTTLLSSCEKVLDFDEKDIKPMLVVNCVVSPDSSVTISLTRSLSAIEETNIFPPVKDASITFSDGSSILTEFEYVSAIDSFQDFLMYGPVSFKKFETGHYVNKQLKIAPGKIYSLSVSADGFDDINAQTNIPVPVKIDKIDTFSTIEKDQYFETIFKKASIQFTDPAETNNYYRLNFDVASITIYFDRQTGEMNLQPSFYSQYINSDDPVFGTNSDTDIFGSGAGNRYSIFNDMLFKGKSYSIDLNLETEYRQLNVDSENNPYYNNWEYSSYKIYKVELLSLSESYFNYIKTVGLQQNAAGDPFSDPVLVYTNIDKGAGVFGAVSSSSFYMVSHNLTPELLLELPAGDNEALYNYIKTEAAKYYYSY